MSSNIFNWGLIGTGGIATAFSDDISRLSNHKVSAVLSRTIDNAEEFAAQRLGCNPYDNDVCFVPVRLLMSQKHRLPTQSADYKLRDSGL